MASQPQFCDRRIKEKPYEQNKRASCQAEMNGLSQLLPQSPDKVSGSLVLWALLWLTCFFACLMTPSLIPCPSAGSQNFPLLTLSQAGRSFPRLSTQPPGAGFRMECPGSHHQDASGSLCSFKPPRSLPILRAMFPMVCI